MALKPSPDELSIDVARWPRERSYLVGVSGGLDSMTLWRSLRDAGYGELVIVHVDHGLRGSESEADAAFVAEAAKGSGTACEIRRVDVGAFAADEGLSIETASRELRYRAFAAVAVERGIPRVILAHHADDRVETVLMNLFRGSGSRGLVGMEAESRRPVGGIELSLIRPWLGVSRARILARAESLGIPWREDHSNASDFALRNRVRRRLLPEIEAVFGRDPRPAILRAAALAELDEAWIAERLGPLPRRGEGLDVKALRASPESQRNRLLLAWLRESGVPDCGFEEVRRAAAVLMTSARPARSSLPGGHWVRRREGVLFIERA